MTNHRFYLDEVPEAVSFDAETHAGLALLISASLPNGTFVRLFDNYEPLGSKKMIYWIWNLLRSDSGSSRHTAHNDRIGTVYNLTHEFGAFAKPAFLSGSLSDKALKEYWKSRTKRVGRFRVKLYPHKALIIENVKDRHKVYVFDAANFYKTEEGTLSLDDASQRFLHAKKLRGVNRARLGTSLTYWRKTGINRIGKYCDRDAQLTRQLTEILYTNMKETLGVIPRYLFSPASFTKAWLDAKHPEYKYRFVKQYRKGVLTSPMGFTRNDIEFIFHCYNGGMFLTKTFGHVKNVSLADLRSAYPYEIANLYKLDNVEKVYVNDYHSDPRILYSFYEVELQLIEDCPMAYRHNHDTLIYPISGRPIKMWLTGLELRSYIDHVFNHPVLNPRDEIKRGEIPSESIEYPRVIRGIELWLKPGAVHELAFPELRSIFDKRAKLKEKFEASGKKDSALDAQQWLLKLVMNSGYGTEHQHRPNFTPFTNFVWSSYITAGCRVAMWQMMWAVGVENVVSVMTDGILYKFGRGNNYWEREASKKTGLGGIEFKVPYGTADATIYQTGVYVLKHHNGKSEIRTRSFPKKALAKALRTARGSVCWVGYKHMVTLTEALRASEDDRFESVQRANRVYVKWHPLKLKSNNDRRIIDAPFKFQHWRKYSVPSYPLVVTTNPVDLRSLPINQFVSWEWVQYIERMKPVWAVENAFCYLMNTQVPANATCSQIDAIAAQAELVVAKLSLPQLERVRKGEMELPVLVLPPAS
jgi:hypothetical protein